MSQSLDPSKIEIFRLSESHDTSKFSCGQADLDTFIQKEALDFQKEALGITHLFYYDNKLVGFVTLSMADIRKKILPDGISPDISIKNNPALLIGRLGVTKEKQGRKIGTFICNWSRAKALTNLEWIGCRFLIVDAKPDTTIFYKKCGFTMLPDQDDKKLKIMINCIINDAQSYRSLTLNLR